MTRSALAIASFLLLSGMAAAQTETLTYTDGNAYTGTETTTNENPSIGSATYAVQGFFGGSVTLATALGANVTNEVVTPVSWSFNQPATVEGAFVFEPALNSQSAAQYVGGAAETATFSFSTVNSVITGWAIDVSIGPWGGTNASSAALFASSNLTGDSYDIGASGPSYSFSTQVTSMSGSWADPPNAIAAPEVSMSGFLSAVFLLGGGLAVLRGRVR